MDIKKKTILFNSVEAFGPMNPLINLAKKLKTRGHDIVFVSNDSFRQTIKNYGFIYEAKLPETIDTTNPQAFSDFIMSTGILTAKTSYDSLKIMNKYNLLAGIASHSRQLEKTVIKRCIHRHKPDILVVNSLLGSAEIVYSGIPWVAVYTESPIEIYNSELIPPYMSGYATKGNIEDWTEYRMELNKYRKLMRESINNSYIENGFSPISHYFPESPYLNIYGYPKELDYEDIVPLPPNWVRVDSFISERTDRHFTIPVELANKPGKLIYVSMGTVCSSNLELMNKLVNILSNSPNRFILSKGHRDAEYDVWDNMWGARYLPQTLILPIVDLFITHGGNNSVNEAFYFGTPMIVLPIFADQFDNAQRVHETGYGIRLDAQQLNEFELLSAIETILNGPEFKEKFQKVSQRIINDKSLDEAVRRIEKLI